MNRHCGGGGLGFLATCSAPPLFLEIGGVRSQTLTGPPLESPLINYDVSTDISTSIPSSHFGDYAVRCPFGDVKGPFAEHVLPIYAQATMMGDGNNWNAGPHDYC